MQKELSTYVDIISETAFGLHLRNKWLEKLVEDVVASLHLLLLSDPRLLEKIRLDVAPSQLPRSVEVDTDKLSKPGQQLDGLVILRKSDLEELSFLEVLAFP